MKFAWDKYFIPSTLILLLTKINFSKFGKFAFIISLIFSDVIPILLKSLLKSNNFNFRNFKYSISLSNSSHLISSKFLNVFIFLKENQDFFVIKIYFIPSIIIFEILLLMHK